MQFKKVTSIFLMVLILFSNLGLAVNVHYCHDRIASISLAYQEKGACVKDKQEKKCCAAKKQEKKCCSNSVVKAEKKSDNILVQSLHLDLPAFILPAVQIPVFFEPKEVITQQEWLYFYCDSNAPPLYKLYCQYLLYA
jgi:hypothetical protein